MAGTRKGSARDLMARIKEMQKQGISEKDIAEALHMTTMSLRRFKSGYFGGMNEVYDQWVDYLKKEGKTINEIALIIGKAESSVRLIDTMTNDDVISEEA